AIPWVYSDTDSGPFHAAFRGMKQRLPNGNTLIVDPDNRRLFEVTRDKELVWENFCPLPPVPPNQTGGEWRVAGDGNDPPPATRHPPPATGYAITGAWRYSADELTFLKGVARARP